MSKEKEYHELYDRLMAEVTALHRSNRRRIRSGMRMLVVVTVGLMLLMFLAEGNKVKVSIRFRGRQITHTEIGAQVMNDFYDRMKDKCVVERKPLVEGRHMIMILAPKENKEVK